MSEPLPAMASLVAFEHAARTSSFKRAAAELHVSPSALTRQIQALEAHLGCSLFRRTPAGLELTEAGQRYLEVAARCLSQLRQAQAGIERHKPLRISSLQSFSETCLIPRLPELRRVHPELELEIEATLRYADFARDDVDAAIRFGTGPWPGLHAEPLVELWLFPVCSPQLLESGPALRAPDDLAQHTLIHISQVPNAWQAWLHSAGVAMPPERRGLRFDHVSLALSAAEAGLGVALSTELLCGRRIAAGQLAAALPQRVRSAATFHFVCRPESLHDPRIATLRSWLVSAF